MSAVCLISHVQLGNTTARRCAEKAMENANEDRKRSILFSLQRKLDLCPLVPARYVLAVMSFLGLFIIFGLRVNLSVAVVEMDYKTATPHSNSARVSVLPLLYLLIRTF